MAVPSVHRSRYGPEVVRDAWAGSRAVKGDVRSLDAFSNSISALGGVSIADEFNQFAPLTAEFAAARLRNRSK